MFEDWKEEFRKIKEELEDDFEEVVDNAYENSVHKAPVNYSANTKAKSNSNAKKIFAIGAAALIIVSSGYFVSNKIENEKMNAQINHFISQNYAGIVTCDRTDGNEHVFYHNDKTAEYIMSCDNFDEAVYVAWYSMDYNKTENMNEVFSYLPGNKTFYGYLRDKEFVDEKGKVDLEAYSDSMKDQIIQAQKDGKGTK